MWNHLPAAGKLVHVVVHVVLHVALHVALHVVHTPRTRHTHSADVQSPVRQQKKVDFFLHSQVKNGEQQGIVPLLRL